MRLLPQRVALFILFVLACALPSRAQISGTGSPPPVEPTPKVSRSKTQPARPKRKVRHRATPRPIGRKNGSQQNSTQKVVVRHGGTTEPLAQMAPVAPQRQDSAERRKSGQLLTAAESNLKSLTGRKLTADQQTTVTQVRQFMEQSRAALDAGDLTQGLNLASKANVLSEELAKH